MDRRVLPPGQWGPGLKVAPRACRICGEVLDGATCVNDPTAAPSDGSVALCIMCGAINVYEGDHFRAPTDEEREALPNDVLLLVGIIRTQRKDDAAR